MTPTSVPGTLWLIVEFVMKIVALGVVPENRRPSSSSAWLLLILFVPVIGFPLYWLIGSPWVTGRRRAIQRESDQVIKDHMAGVPLVPSDARPAQTLGGVLRMNRDLTGMPSLTGSVDCLLADAEETYEAMARAVDGARRYVHDEFYIMA